jgi:hypothetical protein
MIDEVSDPRIEWTTTSGALAKYLGKPVADFLKASPLQGRPAVKSRDIDLERIDYVFEGHGLEVSCDDDGDETVRTIFLYPAESDGFRLGPADIPYSWGRHEVLDCFGAPTKCGGPSRQPLLGDYGPWDRYDLPGHCLHIQYTIGGVTIAMITLMHPDAAP